MTSIPLGYGATVLLVVYLLVLLGLGWLARRARRSESLAEFYLAGRGLGTFVLLLTLYATQYSGNSLLGYPGQAYRLGFGWVMSVGFMMAIVVVYLLFAPRLHLLARRHGFVTPGDWIDHRFGSPVLSFVANLLLVVSMANYLLAQLMAMGHVVAGLSAQMVPYWVGIVLLLLVIAIYESVGGLRAVAWTDCIQGLMLVVGLAGLLVVVAPGPEHLRAVSEWLARERPEKLAVPSGELCRTWLSTLLLVGFAGAVYPQAVQRIYAAKSAGTLKRSLQMMVFMPLATMTTVVLIGILAIPELAGLEGVEADQVMPMLLRRWSEQSIGRYALALIVLVGTLAAIMSTADSVLLSLSSVLAKDFVGKTLLRGAPEERLTRIGKVLSWAILAVLATVAFSSRITLWGLTELKMEILVQVSPVFVLGVTWPRLEARAALTGILTGTVVAVGLTLVGYGKIWGVHAGLIGFAINLVLCRALSSRRQRHGVETPCYGGEAP